MSAKTLLVTGASRGIGRACALLAAQNDWAVGVNYHENAKAAEAVVEAIAKSGGRARQGGRGSRAFAFSPCGRRWIGAQRRDG